MTKLENLLKNLTNTTIKDKTSTNKKKQKKIAKNRLLDFSVIEKDESNFTFKQLNVTEQN